VVVLQEGVTNHPKVRRLRAVRAERCGERERAVSAPAFTAPGCHPGVLREVVKPITGRTGKGWNAERQSEEIIVAMIGVDNITRRSEGSISLLMGRLRPVPLRAATAKAYKKEGEKGAICICITMV
jgi:hypothetical protein